MTSVIVHYQEIALKGRNRPWFIARLVRNLRVATADLDVTSVRALMGRIELSLGPRADWPTIKERLERVFGVANFSMAGRVKLDLDAIAGAILADLGDRSVESFRVSARRADKRYPLTSPQIEREVGGRIKQVKGWRVNLSNPGLTVHLEFLTDQAFYFFGKEKGAGGMPTGVSGRVACLLSGGIDSPVAAFRMMRRGCSVVLVHFHSYPFHSMASQEKVREIATLLTRYQQHTWLYLVPFGEIQRQVVLSVPATLRVVIYRRLMMRIAWMLARASACTGTRHRRGARAGRVADARELVRHRIGRHGAAFSGRSSGWIRTRSPSRRSDSAPIPFRSFLTRIAVSCSRRETQRQRPDLRRPNRLNVCCPSRTSSRRPCRPPGWRSSGFQLSSPHCVSRPWSDLW